MYNYDEFFNFSPTFNGLDFANFYFRYKRKKKQMPMYLVARKINKAQNQYRKYLKRKGK